MKKLLALVLALVMTLSLCVTSNAAFDDAADIEHDEAVEVMNALGVILGKGDNKFDPKGNVTRAEMAKMITIVSIGDVDAAAFVGTTTDLTDINGHWAEGYIKYCYSQGIIAGKGNHLFDPNANVTAAEAAKMLCVAVGYNETIQGYTGADWQINVTRDAQLMGFYDELSVSANTVLTRDQAAQMIYNAICAGTIVPTDTIYSDGKTATSYSKKTDADATLLYKTFKAYNIGDMKLAKTEYDKDKARYKYTFAGWVSFNGGDQHVDTFYSEKDFSDLFAMNVTLVTKYNKEWKQWEALGIFEDNSVVLGETTVSDIEWKENSSNQPDANTDGTFKLLTGLGNFNTDETRVDIFYAFNNYTRTNIPAYGWYDVKLIDNDSDGKLDCVVYVPTVVSKVTYANSKQINTNAAGDSYGAALSSYTFKFEDCDIYEGAAKKDVVLITPAAYTVNDDTVVTKLDTKVTGAVEEVKTFYSSTYAKKVSIDGTNYVLADEDVDRYTLAGGDLSGTAYNGYLFYSDATTEYDLSKFAVVTAVNDHYGLKSGTWAALLMADGTTKEVEVDTDDSGAVDEGSFVVVVDTNSDGQYTLVEADDDSIVCTTPATGEYKVDFDEKLDSDSYAKGDTRTEGGYYIANDAVIFTQNSSGKWVVTTGSAFKKGNNALSTSFANKSSETGYKTIVLGYVDGGELNVSNTNYAVVTSGVSSVKVGDKKVARFTMWTGAESKTVTTEETWDDVLVGKGAVIEYVDNGDGTVKTVTAVEGLEAAVLAYNPVANSSGEYDIGLTTETAEDGLVVDTDADDFIIDKDTEIIFIDRAKDGNTVTYTGVEDGSIVLAVETDTDSGIYYTNVFYAVDEDDENLLTVLVVEIDNNYSNVSMTVR